MMKTAAMIALGFLLALFVLRQKEIPPEKEQPTPVKTQTSSAPKHPLPQSMIKYAKKRGVPVDARFEEIYARSLNSLQRLHFRARIIQHLDDDYLLVELVDWQESDFPRTANFAVFDHPDFDTSADRQIIKIQGCVTGAYTYTTVDGASRTIPEVVCVKTEARQPVGPEKPGAWMLDPNRHTSLDKRPAF